MKYLIRFLFTSMLISIGVGYYFRSSNYSLGNKIIGFSVLFGVFVFMPIFLFHRWKGKRLEDYTLSKENFKKMREKGKNL